MVFWCRWLYSFMLSASTPSFCPTFFLKSVVGELKSVPSVSLPINVPRNIPVYPCTVYTIRKNVVTLWEYAHHTFAALKSVQLVPSTKFYVVPFIKKKYLKPSLYVILISYSVRYPERGRGKNFPRLSFGFPPSAQAIIGRAENCLLFPGSEKKFLVFLRRGRERDTFSWGSEGRCQIAAIPSKMGEVLSRTRTDFVQLPAALTNYWQRKKNFNYFQGIKIISQKILLVRELRTYPTLKSNLVNDCWISHPEENFGREISECILHTTNSLWGIIPQIAQLSQFYDLAASPQVKITKKSSLLS